MKEILNKSWVFIKTNFVSLLLFEFVYKIATTAIILFIMDNGVSLSLKQNKFSYLTAENFVQFLKSPITILFLIVCIILLLGFLLVEVCTLFVCFQFSYNKQKIFMTDMFLLGIERTGKFLKDGHISWILCVLFSVPFLCLHLIIREVYYVKVLNYAFRIIYIGLPNKFVAIAILMLFLLLSVLFVFSLPYCILEGKKTLGGMLASVKLILKNFYKTSVSLIVCNILVTVVTMILYLFCMVLAVIYVVMTKEATVAIAAVLAISQKIEMAIGIVSGAIGIVVNLAFIYTLYIHYVKGKAPARLSLPWNDKDLLHGKIGRRRIAAVLGMVLLCIELFYVYNFVSNTQTLAQNLLNTTKVTAHRGGAAMAPENTVGAIEKAIESMADYAEIDIQETKDGELILMHDNNLLRTTGLNAYVWEVIYDDIKDIEVVNKFGEEFKGEKIATLREVLELCKGTINLNLEVKYNGRNDNIVGKVIALIEEYDFVDQCVVSSMNYNFLKKAKELNPDIVTGYIMTMTYGSISNMEAADFFSVKWSYIDENFVEEAHRYGKEVYCWTVNYAGTLQKMKSLSVDNVITDKPILAIETLSGKEGSVTFAELLKYVLQ